MARLILLIQVLFATAKSTQLLSRRLCSLGCYQWENVSNRSTRQNRFSESLKLIFALGWAFSD